MEISFFSGKKNNVRDSDWTFHARKTSQLFSETVNYRKIFIKATHSVLAGYEKLAGRGVEQVRNGETLINNKQN